MKSDLIEIRTLFLRYLKEETLQPLKELGRFALFGAIGSVFVGFGLTMLLLGALRFLQQEFRVLDGSLSWLPYLIVVVLAALVITFTIWRVVSGAAKRRLKVSE
jgi:H+/Cl- antiporter ClcA